jgi:hypothetical protein
MVKTTTETVTIKEETIKTTASGIMKTVKTQSTTKQVVIKKS